jgi:hypothetical protein
VRTRQRPAGVCDGLDGELRRTSKLPLYRDVVYDAIASMLRDGFERQAKKSAKLENARRSAGSLSTMR